MSYDLSAPDSSWEEINDKGDFKNYYKDDKESGTGKVLMIGVADATPARCFAVVGDYDEFPNFMPYMQYVKLINENKVDENKTINHVFFYFSAPLIAGRYYTLELADEKNPDGKEGAYRSKWTMEKGKFRRTPDDAEIKKHVKTGLFQKPVETAFNDGYWLFEPLDGGKKTKVTYYVWTNPGGSIPDMAVNKGNKLALPELWKCFTKRLKDSKYGAL
ncbi:MAG: hypothetical protein HQK79_05490 [Desulfobacterales bacterium]|nr:hypothetical protein [Desulfobacterales bacterium]MBF0395349.1 hypothetical protein [Desulfobacterales bacterium]